MRNNTTQKLHFVINTSVCNLMQLYFITDAPVFNFLQLYFIINTPVCNLIQLYFVTNIPVFDFLKLYFVSRKLRKTSTVVISPTILRLKTSAVLRQTKFLSCAEFGSGSNHYFKRKKTIIINGKNRIV